MKSEELKIFTILSYVLIISGILLAVFAFMAIQNYYEPYKFSILIAIISLIIGIVSIRLIKPILKLTSQQNKELYTSYFNVCAGLFGVLLFFGNEINTQLLSEKTCNEYVILDKKHIERQGRYSTDDSILYLSFDYKTEEVLVNYKYWNLVEIGNKINVCKYKSKIGFDLLNIADEKY